MVSIQDVQNTNSSHLLFSKKSASSTPERKPDWKCDTRFFCLTQSVWYALPIHHFLNIKKDDMKAKRKRNIIPLFDLD